MPFNRADYYVRVPATGMPQRCAPNTGVLYKATVNHSNGALTEMPIMDCVADMQVVFAIDNTPTDTNTNPDLFGSIPVGYTAQNIRDQVKEVRVYIVAHEGQIDTAYTYTNSRTVPAAPAPVANEVDIVDTQNGVPVVILPAVPRTVARNYRWKVYSLVLTPYNLR